MAIYTKSGQYINTDQCQVSSFDVWVASILTELGGIKDPTKRLAIRTSSTQAGYASKAALEAALEADGWTLLEATTPSAPTVSSTEIVIGASVTVTIADDGDVRVYKDGVLLVTLTGQTTGDITYIPSTIGNYEFSLVVDGLESSKSEVVSVIAETITVAPDVIYPYEWGGIHKAKGYDLINIQQTGTYGQIITDLAWTSFENYGNYLGDNAPAKWCINRGPWKTGAISNYTITGLNGEIVEIRKGIGFRDKGGVQVPSKTVSAFIRIGN